MYTLGSHARRAAEEWRKYRRAGGQVRIETRTNDIIKSGSADGYHRALVFMDYFMIISGTYNTVLLQVSFK